MKKNEITSLGLVENNSDLVHGLFEVEVAHSISSSHHFSGWKVQGLNFIGVGFKSHARCLHQYTNKSIR